MKSGLRKVQIEIYKSINFQAFSLGNLAIMIIHPEDKAITL